jgi:hypothetical protein
MQAVAFCILLKSAFVGEKISILSKMHGTRIKAETRG